MLTLRASPRRFLIVSRLSTSWGKKGSLSTPPLGSEAVLRTFWWSEQGSEMYTEADILFCVAERSCVQVLPRRFASIISMPRDYSRKPLCRIRPQALVCITWSNCVSQSSDTNWMCLGPCITFTELYLGTPTGTAIGSGLGVYTSRLKATAWTSHVTRIGINCYKSRDVEMHAYLLAVSASYFYIPS